MQVNSIKSRSMCGNSGGNSGGRSAPEKRLPHSKFRALARFRMGLSERHSHRKLQLPRRIRSCRSHEISWHLVISWEVIDSNVLSAIVKARRVTHDAVISELKATVQPIEKVERLGGENEVRTAINALQHPILEFHPRAPLPNAPAMHADRSRDCVALVRPNSPLPWVRPSALGKLRGHCNKNPR